MRLVLLAVGRLKSGPERDLAQRYADRISALCRNAGLAGFDVAEMPEGNGRSAGERRAAEADRILSRAAAAPLVAFDERGTTPTSQEFATLIRVARDGARPALAFAIGGPDGLADGVRERAERLVSFGRLTIPHGLVRILAAEQIYRALTILTGHPYHRDG